MQLVVRPMEMELSVESGNNLLESLVAHQIPISYSCRDGRCGMCACRVVGGTVIESGRRARGFPGATRHQILACQCVLAEDCVVQLPPVESVVVHPARKLGARISSVSELGPELLQLELTTNGPFQFSPGQHVEVEFRKDLIRTYSMASLPADTELRLQMKMHPGGRVAEHLRSQLKVGDTLKLKGPLGSAFLRPNSHEPMLLMAAGTGLAPALSILRALAASQTMRTVRICLGFTSPIEVYGLDEIHDLVRQLPSAHLQVMLAGGELRQRGVRQGLLTDWLRSDCPELGGWSAHVFGSFRAVDSAVRQLRVKGINEDRLHAEAFYPANA